MAASVAKWRVHSQPHFTALGLGEYMVAEDSPRETILRGMRFERLAPTLLYRHLYRAIPRYLSSPTRDRGILAKCREDLEREREAATTPKARDNFTYALRALDAFEGSLNTLPLAGWTLERMAASPPLKFNGVSISVQPTVSIRVRRPRGVDQIGALLVDPAKGIALKTDAAKERATSGMQFTAMLLHHHTTGIHPTNDPKASADHCIVFHSYRQQMVRCPSNYRLPLRNMKAVCEIVRRGWATIEPPPDFDPAYADYR